MIRFILVFLGFSGCSAWSFENHQVRYLNGFELFNALKAVYPDLKDQSSLGDSCKQVNRENALSLGVINPKSGELHISKPNPTFIRWYSDCLSRYHKDLVSYLNQHSKDEKIWHEFMGAKAFAALKKENPHIWSLRVSQQPSPAVDLFLDASILRLIGTEELVKSYGLVKSVKDLKHLVHQAAFKPKIQFEEYVGRVHFALLMRDEFLSY